MSHREGCWCDACTIRELRAEVERLREFIRTAALNKGVPQSVVDAALAARLASADIEATSLLMAMVQQWPDVHPDWKPLPDVAGKITQINNMVAGLRARLAEAEHLILRMAGEDYQRARFYVEKYDLTGERAAVSAIDDLKVSIAPSVAELWVCDCGWKNIDREGVCFACQKPRATSTVEASRNGK